MRYGLLALSIAMLTGGGVAARSALDISHSASATQIGEPRTKIEHGTAYGAIPFTAARAQSPR